MLYNKTWLSLCPNPNTLIFLIFSNLKLSIVSLLINPTSNNKKKYGLGRKKIIKLLKNKNIESRPVWGLNHLQKPYKKFQNFKIEKALKLLEESLCLPSSSNQSEDETRKIIKILNG